MAPTERNARRESVAPTIDGGLPSEAGAALAVPYLGGCSPRQMPAVDVDPEPDWGRGGPAATEAGGILQRPRVY